MFVFQISHATNLSRVFAKSFLRYRIAPNEEIFIYVKE